MEFNWPSIAVSTIGLATSAKQDAGNNSLASIDSKTPSLGQATGANSVPVVLPTAQVNALTPPTSVGVNNFPATQAVSGSVAITNLPATQTVAVNNFPSSQPVTGTFFQATQPVSAAALPLPSGASTEATLAALNAKVPAQGQAAMAASHPVVIANNQTAIPIANGALFLSGTGAVLNATPIPATDVSGYGAISVSVTGTFAATLTFEGSNDGTNYFSVNAITASASGAASIQTLATSGMYIVPVVARYFRLRVSAFTSGTVNAAATVFAAAIQDQGLRSATIANSPTVTIGSGGAGIGRLTGRSLANAPLYNVYSTTNITTASYVTMVASLSGATNRIDLFDSSGQAMILATGASGSEAILAYIPPGGLSFDVSIAAGTRIAMKALTANATTGYLLVDFWS